MSVKVIADDLLICGDCIQAIANDDYSGLDYYYGPEEAEKRMKAIQEGIANLGGYPVVGEEYGFSWQGCDCCGSNLGGDKHYCCVLSE